MGALETIIEPIKISSLMYADDKEKNPKITWPIGRRNRKNANGGKHQQKQNNDNRRENSTGPKNDDKM